MQLSRSRHVALLAAPLLALSACGPGDEPAGSPVPAEAPEVTEAPDTEDPGPHDPPSSAPGDMEAGEPETDAAPVPQQVLTAIATVAPIADLVEVVGDGRVAVHPLVPAGADAHTYEPRPGDVVTLSGADAYFGVGLDLNEGVLRLARENLPEDAELVLLGEEFLGGEQLVLDHHHDDHHHDDDGHSHGDDGGHSHGDPDADLGPNPHVWTSIRNTQRLIDGILATLSELDPEGADRYAASASEYGEALDDLDREIVDAMATVPDEHRTLVTYHDAWSYFARDYDLEFATAIQPTDYAEPSAAEMTAVIDLIRQRGVPAVFGSHVFPTPVLEVIADETDAVYIGDLSDDVLPGSPGDPEHSYLELMRRNARTVVDGLGGDASVLR